MTKTEQETLQQALEALQDGDSVAAHVLLAGLLESTPERTEQIYRVQRELQDGKRAWGKDKRDYAHLGHVKQFMRANKSVVESWDVWMGTIRWTRMAPSVVEELLQ